MKGIIDTINYYQTRSADKLQSEQLVNIPVIEENQIEYVINGYYLNNRRHLVNPYKTICIKLSYLKSKNIEFNILSQYIDKVTPLIDLVENNIIEPIALFIDGRCVPWTTFKGDSVIDVVITPLSYYLLINKINYETNRTFVKEDEELSDNEKTKGSDEYIDMKYANIMTLPDYVSFSTSNNTKSLFSFDSKGRFCPQIKGLSKFCFTINNKPNLYYSNITGNVNRFNMMKVTAYDIVDDAHIELKDFKLSDKNVFLFIDGILSCGEKNNIKRGTFCDFTSDHEEYDHYIEMEQSNESLGANPSIRFDDTFLTINNGAALTGSSFDILVYINSAHSNSVENVTKIEDDKLREFISDNRDKYNNHLGKEFILSDHEHHVFEEVDGKKILSQESYNQYITRSIRTILEYDSHAFNNAIKINSNIEFFETDGKTIKEQVNKKDGCLYVPRRHGEMNEEYVIMLVNGTLYKYYHSVKHVFNHCIIPISDINDDDKIEFLRFKDVNNYTFDLTIPKPTASDNGFRMHSSDYVNGDMILFSNVHNKPADESYTYPTNENLYFPVDYTLDTNSADNQIRINLNDEFYYDKPLKVAYRNRFIHSRYLIPSDEYVQYAIDMTEDFMYCNDYSKFIVFHNGYKLDSDLYRIVLPTRATTPFYDIKLYISVAVNAGDSIDVIYTPSLLQDIVYKEEIESNGIIAVDKSILNYSIGSDLYMVWLNGKKIPNSHIKDIDRSRMIIISDEKSVKNLTITKHIPDILYIKDVFMDEKYESNWDKALEGLSIQNIKDMLGITTSNLTASDFDYREGSVDIATIMYELIREQYVINPRVDITDKFIYDYLDIDQSFVTEDGTGSIESPVILPVADANREDNLDGTPWAISNNSGTVSEETV